MATMSEDDVLDRIFNPDGVFALPRKRDKAEEAAAPELSEEEKRMRAQELEAVRKAEAGDHDSALAILNKLVDENPKRAATYNNRAQTLQLKGDVDGALQDIETVLSMADAPQHVRENALIQRAMIRRLREDDDGARRDFEEAAKMGNAFARQQAVQLNPYAALCNQMLARAMKELRDPLGQQAEAEAEAETAAQTAAQTAQTPCDKPCDKPCGGTTCDQAT